MGVVLIQGIVSVLLGLASGFGLGMLTFEEIDVFKKYQKAVLLVVSFVFLLSLLNNLSDGFESVVVLWLSLYLLCFYFGLSGHARFIRK